MANLVEVKFQAPKELNEFRVALIDLIQMIKEKKQLPEILSKLSLFMTAIDGAQNIPNEFKEELKKSVELTGFMGGQLVGVLL